ncbi:TRAP transporter substrate-binding protein [Roseobacter sp.]|uniref:TRAP transporter substrate-binding protein n=1 Tax=Roseobacter sp. TaxID=1907202 RepID=UPI00329826B2
MKSTISLMAMTLALTSSAAFAQELAVVGSWSGLPLHKQYEKPFWEDKMPAASDGEITAALTTHDQMGIGGGDVFRMLSQGIFDVGMTVADYAVSDSAALEGFDVPLIATDADAAQAMVAAGRPLMDEIFADVFNAKVLGVAPYPPQVVFCNAEVGSLADLEGLKIRASGRMTGKLLEALGAEAVSVSFGEVPGALQKGVVDCAVTGAGSGYSAGWWEVSTHLMPIPLGGWDPVVTAINLDKWNDMSPEAQTLLETTVVNELQTPAWATAQTALATDVACLTGQGDCPGAAHSMTLVEATPADEAKARDILVSQVLPDWAERAGGDWGQRWNATVGEATGVQIDLK